MGVHITGRHVEISDDLRDYIERKMDRLDKHTDRIQRVEVVIEKDRYLHRAEARLKAGIIGFTVSETDRDPRKAVDLMLAIVDRQLTKELEQLKGTKHSARVQRKPLAVRAATGAEEVNLPEAAMPATRRARSAANTPAPGVNGRKPSPRKTAPVVRQEPVWLEKLDIHVFNRDPMKLDRTSTEAAAEHLFFADETFHCFVNEDTGRLNVIYRRKDGNFALTELEEA